MLRLKAVVSAAPLICLALAGRAAAAPVLGANPIAPPSASQVADDIETLGEAQFGSTFTGAVLTPADTITVYANLAAIGPLLKAINQVDPGLYPVNYTEASLSYSALNGLVNKLTADQANLSGEGLVLRDAEPNPATDAVDVTLSSPTVSDLSRLSNVTAGADATAATYSSTAQSLITQELGGGYAVTTTNQSAATPASRFNDTSPFSGGDQIFGVVQCTGGFNVTDNSSSKPYMLTAGHCGYSSAWTTEAQVIGSTARTYWKDSNNDDFQLINESIGLPYVWGSGSDSYTMVGQTVPAVGSQMTVGLHDW